MAPSFESEVHPEPPKPPKARLKLNKKRADDLMRALDTIEVHIKVAAEVWSELTDEQRRQLLEHSPVLARFVALAGPFCGERR